MATLSTPVGVDRSNLLREGIVAVAHAPAVGCLQPQHVAAGIVTGDGAAPIVGIRRPGAHHL